ncbi:MAG: hypothetical protein ACI9H6_000846 [Patiriisocius sp.]|jgi:hypothetical protein
MVDAVSELNGFTPGRPDWEDEQLVNDDPVMYADLASADDRIIEGDWNQPHTLRGVETECLKNGMHIITTASLSG